MPQGEPTLEKGAANESDDDYVPYVPVRKRKEAQYYRLASRYSQRRPVAAHDDAGGRSRAGWGGDNGRRPAESGSDDEGDTTAGPRANVKLVEQAAELRKQQLERGKCGVATDIKWFAQN